MSIRDAENKIMAEVVNRLKKEPDCEECQDAGEINGEGCKECCSHEFDSSEGGMCLNCGRDDYYNFMDEDRGQDR